MTRGFPRQDLLGFFWPSPTDLKVFIDRRDGGRRLAPALERYRGEHPLVLGVPRGGVEVAAEVARALGAELDVVVAKKVGAPGHEELAMGAVTADGTLYLNGDLVAALGIPDEAVRAAVRRAHSEAQERDRRLRGDAPLEVAGRTVLLIDDGLATGATMTAAARWARHHGAKRVVVAAPVGAPDTCRALKLEAHDVVCPEQPELFFAVGAHYRRFDPVTDDEAARTLGGARGRPNGEAPAPSP